MTATTKFESESIDSSTLSSSLSTTMSSRNSYWPSGNDWELAAMAMGRTNEGGQHFLINNNIQQQQNNASYYGQMAAVMSAASAVGNVGNTQQNCYPIQNYGNYYGLGGNIQRNTSLNINCGGISYPGIYFPQDYYNNNNITGNYYTSKAFVAAAAQYGNIQPQPQQQNNCSNNNIKYPSTILIDSQSINTGSELDTSPPLITTLNNNNNNLKVSSSNNSQKLNNKTKNNKTDKSNLNINSGRSKKKKITPITSNNQEINQTRVLVWELEDVCSVLPQHHLYKSSLEQVLNDALIKLLEYGFNLDNFDDFDQSNIMDAQMDEALQNAANCTNNNNNNMPSTSSFSEELSNNITENCTINNNNNSFKNSINISSATDGLRKLAEKCRNIRNVFEQNRNINIFNELLKHCGIDSNKLNYMNEIEEKVPEANSKLFRDCLSVIYRRSPLLSHNYVNVILSFNPIEGGIAGVLGRLMLCRMSEFVEAENVFCINRNGKEAVFERLINQFQKKLILLITSNEESRKIAEKNGIICWFIYSNEDLHKLRKAVDIITEHI